MGLDPSVAAPVLLPLPHLGLTHPQRCEYVSVASVECLSVCLSVSLCKEPGGRWQSPWRQ